jgi:hypothetical protein
VAHRCLDRSPRFQRGEESFAGRIIEARPIRPVDGGYPTTDTCREMCGDIGGSASKWKITQWIGARTHIPQRQSNRIAHRPQPAGRLRRPKRSWRIVDRQAHNALRRPASFWDEFVLRASPSEAFPERHSWRLPTRGHALQPGAAPAPGLGGLRRASASRGAGT